MKNPVATTPAAKCEYCAKPIAADQHHCEALVCRLLADGYKPREY